MWQNLVSGILGLWVVLVVFLDFSSTMTRFFLILMGAAVALFSFWALRLVKRERAGQPPLPENKKENSELENAPQ